MKQKVTFLKRTLLLLIVAALFNKVSGQTVVLYETTITSANGWTTNLSTGTSSSVNYSQNNCVFGGGGSITINTAQVRCTTYPGEIGLAGSNRWMDLPSLTFTNNPGATSAGTLSVTWYNNGGGRVFRYYLFDLQGQQIGSATVEGTSSAGVNGNCTTYDFTLPPITGSKVIKISTNGNSSILAVSVKTYSSGTLPTVSSVTASSVTTTTASSGGNVTAEGTASVTAKGVVWNTSAAPTVVLTTKTNDGTGLGAYTSPITSLTANTKYYYRAYATSSVGTAYGAEDNFTTFPNAPASNPANNITLTSFTANWSAPVQGAEAFTYSLQYSTDNTFTTGVTTVSAISSSNTSQSVSGLTSGATYYYRVYAVNATGTSAASATQTVALVDGTLSTDYFRSLASGNWNAGATWESSHDNSTWITATSGPDNNATAIQVRSGHTVTATATTGANNLTVAAGGELDINSGVVFTVANGTGTDITLNGTVKNTGTFTLAASATMTVSGFYEDAQPATTGTVTIPTATWSAGSTCKISGIVGTAPTTPADYNNLQGINQTFSNFIIDVPNLVGKLVLTKNGAALFAVTNTLTVNSTGTSTYGVQLTSSGAQEAISVGSYVQNAGIVSIIHNSSNATAKSFTVAGAFTLNGTSVFNISAYTTGAGVTTLNIGGNLSVAAGATLQRNTSFGTGGTTNLVFNGASAQTAAFGITNGTINYTINNAAGLTLSSDLTANGSFTFTAGNVTTGVNKLIVSSTGSITGGGTGGWVAGNLQKNIATGATSRTFETGGPATYRPVTVSFGNVTTAGDITARVSQAAGDHPDISNSGIDPAKSVNRYWTLTNSGVVFDTYDATFTFIAGDVDGGANTASFIIRKYNGSAWSPTIAGIRTATSTQATGLTSFSDFVIGELATGGGPLVSTQPVSSSVCTGSNASFTSNSASVPAPTIAWERSTDGSSWVPVDGTIDGGIYSNFATTTLNITGATTAITGYQYHAVFTNINGTVTSNAATLTVSPVTVGGTTAGTQTICAGTQPSNLTLSGHTGAVVKWQKASDAAFTSPTDIASTSATLTGATIGTLSATTYFRAVVQSGACSAANSASVLVTADPVSVGGTVAGTQSICTGTQPSNLTLSGNTGSVVKWQKSGDAAFTSPTDIAVTSTTLTGATIGTLSATTYFRAVVQSGACSAANSASVLVSVDPVTVGGTTAGTQTICSGTQPANLTLSGNTGAVVKWQKSGDAAFTSPTDIASTSATLTGATIGTLSATTYFRAVVQSGACSAANSASVTVTVTPVSVGGTTAGTQTICIGNVPSADLTLSGHTGSVTKWQKASDAAFTSPTDIAVTSATLTGAAIGSLTTSAYFRAVVQSGACATANSASVLVTVDAGITNSTALAGTVGGGQVSANYSVSASNNYMSNCNLIATVVPSGASPVSGNVNAAVKIDATVQTAAPNNVPYVQRHFDILPASNPTTATSTITLYFKQSEFTAFNVARGPWAALPASGADAAGIANLRVTQYNGTGTAPGNYTGTAVQIDPVDANITYNATADRWSVTFNATGSGGFYVSSNHFVLPVTLINFKGEIAGEINKLSWTTSTETNNSGFELERSADGRNFSKLTFVATKATNGNSTVALNYSDDDARPLAGNSYYRLKQIDKDGKFSYSNIVMLSRKVTDVVLTSVYPNPATKELNLVITSPRAEKLTVIVTDLTGKVIMQRPVSVVMGENQEQVNVQQLAQGTYIIKAVCANGCETAVHRFVKQ